MPDLSDLYRQNLLNLTMRAVLTGGLPQTFEALTLLKNFVRLVDQTLESYELARTLFAKFVASTGGAGFSDMFRAQGYMENCVVGLDRAVRHLQRIRRRKDFAGVVPRLTVLTKPAPHEISDFRNAIEHAEERIFNGRVKPSDTVMLWMDDDAIELEGRRITYAQLSVWLIEIHALAFELTISRYMI